MKIIAAIEDPTVIKKILTHLGLPTKPPEPWPARGPPAADLCEPRQHFFRFLAKTSLILGLPSSQSITGLPGYQGGIGHQISANLLFELSYRFVRMKGTIESAPFSLQIDEATLPGFLVGLNFLF